MPNVFKQDEILEEAKRQCWFMSRVISLSPFSIDFLKLD